MQQEQAPKSVMRISRLNQIPSHFGLARDYAYFMNDLNDIECLQSKEQGAPWPPCTTGAFREIVSHKGAGGHGKLRWTLGKDAESECSSKLKWWFNSFGHPHFFLLGHSPIVQRQVWSSDWSASCHIKLQHQIQSSVPSSTVQNSASDLQISQIQYNAP